MVIKPPKALNKQNSLFKRVNLTTLNHRPVKVNSLTKRYFIYRTPNPYRENKYRLPGLFVIEL
ncbi:hypothetical protein Hanom_Chr02g00101341 [Helianthus anomalus]